MYNLWQEIKEINNINKKIPEKYETSTITEYLKPIIKI